MVVLGIMSGTSLDGIDLVLCRFRTVKNRWSFSVLKAQTFEYSAYWKNCLTTAQNLNSVDLLLLHNEYGEFIGHTIRDFLGISENADLVASHGHTIFHKPEKKLTFQLGSPACIAATCDIPVCADFRTSDVALGGQGAPLVPVGDKLLFGGYGFCLNLGGFANISHDLKGTRIACDLGPVNIVANHLASLAEREFDKDGLMGRGGVLSEDLVRELDDLEFYGVTGPKSLGREWVETVFLPVIDRYKLPVPDTLRSVYEHIAGQISRYLNRYPASSVLVTGGGAFNVYLMELLEMKCHSELIVPDQKVVKYKEAIIFAFLGMLRQMNKTNCLSSVTGASRDSSAGGIYL